MDIKIIHTYLVHLLGNCTICYSNTQFMAIYFHVLSFRWSSSSFWISITKYFVIRFGFVQGLELLNIFMNCKYNTYAIVLRIYNIHILLWNRIECVFLIHVPVNILISTQTGICIRGTACNLGHRVILDSKGKIGH